MSDPLQSLTGDPAGALVLRRSLSELAGRVDASLAEQIREVLAGRRDVRELWDDPEFSAFAQRGMAEFTDEWDALPLDARDAAIEAGTAYLAALEDEDGC